MRYFNIPHYKSLVELKQRIDKVNLKGIEIAERRMGIEPFPKNCVKVLLIYYP